MPVGYDLKTQKLLSGVASVTHGTTYTPSTAPSPVMADVMYAEKCRVKVEATGSAAGTGNLTFNFVAIGHPGETYPTVASFNVVVPLNGTTPVGKDLIVDCSAYIEIKLLSVQNADASADATNVMATVDYKI
jgi:hypothetical protein